MMINPSDVFGPQRDFPSKEKILEMSTKDFADILLKCMVNELDGAYGPMVRPLFEFNEYIFNQHNAAIRVSTESVSPGDTTYHAPQPPEIKNKAMESMSWLEREGYIAPAHGDVYKKRITQKGIKAGGNTNTVFSSDTAQWSFENLHEKLPKSLSAIFATEDYSNAVANAFTAVEIAVREKGGFSKDDVGGKLMRNAFKTTDKNGNGASGPLTNSAHTFSEQESIAHLFSGAFGYFRNSNSHKDASNSRPEIAYGAILLADLLLRLVDEAPCPDPEPTE